MNLKKIISNNLQGKKVFFFFVLSGIFYFTMFFVTIPKLTEFSNGLPVFDMRFNGYNLFDAKELLQHLGNAGKDFYLFRQLPLDFIYPLIFAWSNILILCFFLKKIQKFDTWFLLISVPIIGGVFDYLENFGIIYMLTSYPDISETSVKMISIFTVIKNVFISLYVAVLLIVLCIFLFKKLKKSSL
jgi:hypothetical protein